MKKILPIILLSFSACTIFSEIEESQVQFEQLVEQPLELNQSSTDLRFPRCGDNICNNQETTQSCRQDCPIRGDCRDNDGVLDTNLDNDRYNCGYCHYVCPAILNSENVTCELGECVILSCQPFYGDCDEFFYNGCETDLVNDFHCGGCGKLYRCPFGKHCEQHGDTDPVCL